MRERYRKWGRVIRYEHERFVRVDEAGEAIESPELFLAAPIAERVELPDVDEEAVAAVAREVESLVRTERLLVSDGVAAHEFGGIRWQERTRRLHVAIPLGRERALLDLAAFDLDPVRRIAAATLQAERRADSVRLAPNVTETLLPHLIGMVDMDQMPAPHDGKGAAVEQAFVTGLPPNWYRPSYRVRPLRAWFRLRPRPFGTIDPAAPEALALLGPVDLRALRLLCIDGDALFPVTVSIAGVKAAAESATMMI